MSWHVDEAEEPFGACYGKGFAGGDGRRGDSVVDHFDIGVGADVFDADFFFWEKDDGPVGYCVWADGCEDDGIEFGS